MPLCPYAYAPMHLCTYARWTQVIRMLQERAGRKVVMCGDGGNDVGALKQGVHVPIGVHVYRPSLIESAAGMHVYGCTWVCMCL